MVHLVASINGHVKVVVWSEACLLCIQFTDVANPLGDERFVDMFSNPNFQIDEESEVLHMTSLLTTLMYSQLTL